LLRTWAITLDQLRYRIEYHLIEIRGPRTPHEVPILRYRTKDLRAKECLNSIQIFTL